MLNNLRETLIVSKESRETFLPLQGEAASPLALRSISMAGISQLRGRYEVYRPSPAYHVVLMTIGGGGKLIVGDEQITLGPGTVAVLPAGIVHHYRGGKGGWGLLWFHLGKRKRWRELEGPAPIITSGVDTQSHASIANHYAEECRSGRHGEARLLAEVLARRLERTIGISASTGSGTEERLREVLREVEHNLARPWTAAQMARQAHFSVQHFNRLAREYWGETPIRKVTALRMGRADQLLRVTTLTVAEIASLVGYTDAFAFSSSFRRHFGVSPRTWRKNRPS